MNEIQRIKPDRYSGEEWRLRLELAACYRVRAARLGRGNFQPHHRARAPEPEKQYLINPFGLTFGEVTAITLVKIDLAANLVEPTDYGVNRAGFVIHSAIHSVRDDAHLIRAVPQCGVPGRLRGGL